MFKFFGRLRGVVKATPSRNALTSRTAEPNPGYVTEALLRQYYGRLDVNLVHLADRAGCEVRVGRKRFEVSYVPIAWANTSDEIRAAMSNAKQLEDLA